MRTWEAHSGQKEQRMPSTEACLGNGKDVIIPFVYWTVSRGGAERRWCEIS